jgi:uncharacterized protein YndB with AHSA1/START domain
MADNPDSRDIVREIEIDAPIDAVWKALTEGGEVAKWLCEEAHVTPGVGGSYRKCWGGGQWSESTIEAWEPEHRLRVRQTMGSSTMVQEYTLESRGQTTVLRLVDSGIPDSPEWEGMYDSKSRGWTFYFYALKHYLEKHLGEPRHHIVEMRTIDCDLDEAWTRLTGPEGLAANGSIADLPEGSAFSATASTGDLLKGTVLTNMPPRMLILVVDSLDQAFLGITLEGMGARKFIYFSLATFGRDAADDAALAERWTALLGRLFPTPS